MTQRQGGMSGTRLQQSPGLPWRVASSAVMGLTSAVSRAFLFGFNSVEVRGLQRFLEVLDRRKDVGTRTRGLITVSNHVGVLDDPLIWGVFPLRYGFDPQNHRWSLGAHDICFKNSLLSTFFTYGQVLPTYRLKHSPYGGPFQPTMSEAIRLLSDHPGRGQSAQGMSPESAAPDAIPAGAFSPDGHHSASSLAPPPPIPATAPSSFASHRHSWIHIFPEGCVHQHPATGLRYFKWGVARLLLESSPAGAAPEVVPMFVDGSQHIMPEDRKWPRFAPRFGARVTVAFGEPLDGEALVGDLRARWQALVRRVRSSATSAAGIDGDRNNPNLPVFAPGDLPEEELRFGPEAEALRIEAAMRMRDEVLRLRRSLGFPDEDPTARLGYAETWAEDRQGVAGQRKKYKSRVDDSLINQD